VEWVHGPENPVAEALVVAVMSDGEDLCGASVEGDNVTVGEVAGWESRAPLTDDSHGSQKRKLD
jgi:hypothetical protein